MYLNDVSIDTSSIFLGGHSILHILFSKDKKILKYLIPLMRTNKLVI